MIALHETAGWPLSYVGDLFGCNKGRVSRIIKQTKAELRALFGEDWQQRET
jgi:DNA-directed RNA polymerase specialized sigma24 family protein